MELRYLVRYQFSVHQYGWYTEEDGAAALRARQHWVARGGASFCAGEQKKRACIFSQDGTYIGSKFILASYSLDRIDTCN